MRERAMLIGAVITIDAAPTGGTRVQLTIPTDAKDPRC
jgi:signal transduction histidine kinase